MNHAWLIAAGLLAILLIGVVLMTAHLTPKPQGVVRSGDIVSPAHPPKLIQDRVPQPQTKTH